MSEYYRSPALENYVSFSQRASLSKTEALIRSRVWDTILDQKLKPGIKLPEEEICAAFKVSRTIVRKVLVILEQEGILRISPGRGAYVASPDKAEVMEIFEILRMLSEHIICGLADKKRQMLTPEKTKLLKMHLDAQVKLGTRDFKTQHRLNAEFFILLAILYGNSGMTAAMERIVARKILAIMIYEKMRAEELPHNQLSTIIELIIAGRGSEASVAMGKFLSALEQDLQPSESREEDGLMNILSPVGVKVRRKVKHYRDETPKSRFQ